jgi:hypothetical protein
MLAFPATDPLVNLKVERSVAGQYAADRQVILDQMNAMARRGPANGRGVERRTEQGVEIVALHNPSLAGGIPGMVTLFDDAQEVILTAYLLTQKRRAFQNFEEYQTLRDRFVGDLAACMAGLRNRAAPPPQQ